MTCLPLFNRVSKSSVTSCPVAMVQKITFILNDLTTWRHYYKPSQIQESPPFQSLHWSYHYKSLITKHHQLVQQQRKVLFWVRGGKCTTSPSRQQPNVGQTQLHQVLPELSSRQPWIPHHLTHIWDSALTHAICRYAIFDVVKDTFQ